MQAFARTALLAVIGLLISGTFARASRIEFDVRAPKDLPDGLTITSKADKRGTIAFDVAVDADKVAHAGELYAGRVKPHAVLTVSTDAEEIASVTLQGETEGKLTHYYFRVAPSTLKSSELQLGVSLYEKDGHSTLGGGVSMQVHLAGFDPTKKVGKANSIR